VKSLLNCVLGSLGLLGWESGFKTRSGLSSRFIY
jgi:hypothetical protein